MTFKTKRNLFAELNEGLDALVSLRAGKQTLRTHSVEFPAAPEIDAAELVRKRLEPN